MKINFFLTAISLICCTVLSPLQADEEQAPLSEKDHKELRGPRGHRGHRGKRGRKGEKGHIGPTGPTGPIGPSFVVDYGTFNVPGDPQTLVADGAIIPFSVTQVSSGITNAAGDITLTRSGVYLVTFGVIIDPETGAADHFDIELSGTVVSGGSFFPGPGFVFNTITVMFTAVAGEHLVVKNVSGHPTLIGILGIDQIPAYISILQIN